MDELAKIRLELDRSWDYQLAWCVVRAETLAWLAGCGRERVLFSDLSRALITNRKGRRARSKESRAELRAVLAQLQDDGLVVLRPTESGRGVPGLYVSLATAPKDGSTHGGAVE